MTKINLILRKAGVLPFRFKDGKLEILLVTARDSRRWTLPKGNVEPGETASSAAIREAFEEAGVEGTLQSEEPFGAYQYVKRMRGGDGQPAMVDIFLMRVSRQSPSWPEMSRRKTIWLSAGKAAKNVDITGIVRLIDRLAAIEQDLRISPI